VIVDTSVWINHFRRPNADLEYLLDGYRVVMHPFVIGELGVRIDGAASGSPASARGRCRRPLSPRKTSS